MPLTSIYALVKDDLDATTRAIFSHMKCDIPMVHNMVEYMMGCGGKRIRPLVVLLTANALSHRENAHIDLAAVIELIHTASLLHDDVVDLSILRRGKQTAHLVWSTEASILAGDFLYLRAFQVIVDMKRERLITIFSDAMQLLALGELNQLVNCRNPDTTESQYMDIIERKTAKLFEIASESGAILGTESQDKVLAMRDFGRHLGLAYQLVDDLLDYTQPTEETGKPKGQDLAEGKVTLPLIHALRQSGKSQQERLKNAIQKDHSYDFNEILGMIESTDALKYTAEAAKQHIQKAKEALRHIADTPYRVALHTLADFVVERTY